MVLIIISMLVGMAHSADLLNGLGMFSPTSLPQWTKNSTTYYPELLTVRSLHLRLHSLLLMLDSS